MSIDIFLSNMCFLYECQAWTTLYLLMPRLKATGVHRFGDELPKATSVIPIPQCFHPLPFKRGVQPLQGFFETFLSRSKKSFNPLMELPMLWLPSDSTFLLQKVLQPLAPAGMPQFSQRLGLDLSDTFPCDVKLLAHFLQCAGLAIVQTVA